MAGGGAQVTYPLDTLRLRLAVDPAAVCGCVWGAEAWRVGARR